MEINTREPIEPNPTSSLNEQSALFCIEPSVLMDSNNSYFLIVPREIRERTYQYVLLGVCVVVHHHTPAELRDADVNPSGLPQTCKEWQDYYPQRMIRGFKSLLLTCRTIYDEFRTAIFREPFFFFRRARALMHSNLYNSLYWKTSVRLDKLNGSTVNPLHWIQNLEINFITSLRHRDSPDTIQSALSVVAFSMPNLKRLQLQTDKIDIIFEGKRLLQPWFLRCLCSLGPLEYFAIRLRPHPTGIPLLVEYCLLAIQNIINVYVCGAENRAPTSLQVPRVLRVEDKEISIWFAKEMIRFFSVDDNAPSNKFVTWLTHDLNQLEAL